MKTSLEWGKMCADIKHLETLIFFQAPVPEYDSTFIPKKNQF